MKRAFPFLMMALFFLAGCASTPRMTSSPVKETREKTIVLLHGMHFDGGLWAEVKPLLGNTTDIFTPTMLGRTVAEHANLLEIAQDLCAQTIGQAVIVAHSFAGAVANQMTTVCPNRINRIIYVAAVVPLNNERAIDQYNQAEQRYYAKAVSFDKERMAPQAPKVFLKSMDAMLDPKKLPTVKLYSESYGPGQDRVAIDNAKFDEIPKYYIFTSMDKVITPENQKRMADRLKLAGTATIASGHLPMLSKPQDLATVIKEFAK